MATTSQLRSSYPEFIVRWPTSTTNPRCDFSKAVPVLFLASTSISSTRRISLKVHPATRQAWRALAAVMLHFGYEFRETAGGTLSCRKITGGSGTTLHAHGIAGDWNPSKNRYKIKVGLIQWGIDTDMPRAMVRAIEAITMTNGRHPFEWGGRWWNIKDAMHYELDQLQTNLAPVNLATLPAGSWAKYLEFERGHLPPEGDEPMLSQMQGTKSEAVARHQRDLIALDYDLGDFEPFGPGFPRGADGFWGGTTAGADEAFESEHGLPVTGKGPALTVDLARELARAGGGGDHPDGDHASLASKATVDAQIADLASRLDAHAAARAGGQIHPHVHDEGQTGPAK